MADLTITFNYYRGMVTNPQDENRFIGSYTSVVPNLTRIQFSTPGGVAYADPTYLKQTGWNNALYTGTDVEAKVGNTVFNMLYIQDTPTYPLTAPVDPFALNANDAADFYDYIIGKYNTTSATGQPLNNVALSYPPKVLGNTDDPAYSPLYACFISAYNYMYIGALQSYDASNDWAPITTPPVD